MIRFPFILKVNRMLYFVSTPYFLFCAELMRRAFSIRQKTKILHIFSRVLWNAGAVADRRRAASTPPLQNPERFCNSTAFCVDAALIQVLIWITSLEIFRTRRKETTLDKFAFASSCDVSVFPSGRLL